MAGVRKGPSVQANQLEAAQASQLVARAKEGDREAFDGLVELYAARMYNLALRITGSPEDAEDCVQDAFVKAFSGIRGFRGEAAFSTWLYRVAINVAVECARKRARRPAAASELISDSTGEEAAADLEEVARAGPEVSSPTPEEEVIARQRRQVVLTAIDGLPQHQRIALVLYDFQGLSYDEIARVTKTRVGTVKSRLNRARLTLRDRLADHMELLKG